jgi:hypothetical protein
MFLDAFTRVSNAQAFGAAAVSTDSIDLANVTPKRKVGTGEPMGFGVAITTAGTVAATLMEVISATDAALTAGILVHATRTIPLAETVLGALFFLPLPPGTPTQRFMGVRMTTAGGTISATVWLTTQSAFSLLPENYAVGYVIS